MINRNTRVFLNYRIGLIYFCFSIYGLIAAPITKPYDEFLDYLDQNHCELNSRIKVEFPTEGAQNFEYLTEPLKVCQSLDPSDHIYREISLLCHDIFDIFKNISCNFHPNDNSTEISVPISKNVCNDFSSLQFSPSLSSESIIPKLADTMVCGIICQDEFSAACTFLLWSYKVLQEIMELHDQKLTDAPEQSSLQKSINENLDLDNQHEIEMHPEELKNEDNKKDSDIENIETKSNTNNNEKADIEETVDFKNDINNNSIKPTTETLTSLPKEISSEKNPQKLVEESKEKQDSEAKQSSPLVPTDKTSGTDLASKSTISTSAVQDTTNRMKEAVASHIKLVDDGPQEGVTESKPDNIKSAIVTKSEVETSPSLGKTNTDEKGTDLADTTASLTTLKNKIPDVSEQKHIEDQPKNIQENIITSKSPPTMLVSSVSPRLMSQNPTDIPLEKMEEDNMKIPEENEDQQYGDNGDDVEYGETLFERNKERTVVVKITPPVQRPKPVEQERPRTFDNLPENRYFNEPKLFPEQEDGHFFFYFVSMILIFMAIYLLVHNKQKIIALIVEGRHERRRRSHGAGYKKLEAK